MNYSLIQIAINRTVRDASRLMAVTRIRHLAVTENNKIVGLLSVRAPIPSQDLAALFMNVSLAVGDSPLRQACLA